MRTVGVIGAGVMGTGVAQNLAQRGVETILVDIDDDVLLRSHKTIRRDVRMHGMLDPNAERHDPQDVLSRIAFTTDLERLRSVDFVVENVTEKWDVKRQVYERLEAVCPPHCVYAANTSAISITRIGSATRRPDRVVGMHFMNPVPLKPMVELIRGFHTSEESLAIAREFLTQMGKECVVVEDSPGFVSNRVLMLTVNEAVFLVHDGVAAAEEVDTIFKRCFGHKMGPLETADLIGLDTILYSIEVLHESFADSKYRPCPLLKKMVDAGLHGRKSGRGFYRYDA